MTATMKTARDEILAVFKTAWDVTELPVLYEDVEGDPPDAGAWARVTVRLSGGEVATLASDTGKRRFRRDGFLIAQVFTPSGDGKVLMDQLVPIVRDAFEGVTTVSGVIFRKVGAAELGRSGRWIQTNVTATFEYDEIK